MTWSYMDTRDLAQCVRLALEAEGLGYQAFNIAQADCSSNLPTKELLRRYYPNVPVKDELDEFETLLRIPTKPAGYSRAKSAMYSNLIAATLPN
jgi:nucleoside-diphosphate-sugar epimerase